MTALNFSLKLIAHLPLVTHDEYVLVLGFRRLNKWRYNGFYHCRSHFSPVSAQVASTGK